MRACILCGKEKDSTSSNNFSLFRVPKDVEERNSWIKYFGKHLPESYHVCSKHFPDSCLAKVGRCIQLRRKEFSNIIHGHQIETTATCLKSDDLTEIQIDEADLKLQLNYEKLLSTLMFNKTEEILEENKENLQNKGTENELEQNFNEAELNFLGEITPNEGNGGPILLNGLLTPKKSKETEFHFVINSLENILEEEASESKYCDICLNDSPENITLFNTEDAKVATIRNMLQCVIPEFNFKTNSSICAQCESRLTEAYNFKQTWLKSEQILKEMTQIQNVIENYSSSSVEKIQSDETPTASPLKRVKPQELATLEKPNVPHKSNTSILKQHLQRSTRSLKKGKTKRRIIDNSTSFFLEDHDYSVKPPLSKKELKGGPPYLCELCGSVFKCWIYYYRHKQRVHLVEKVKPKAGKKGERVIKAGKGGPPYLCEICGFVRKTWSGMSSHKRKVHINPKQKTYICEICGKTVPNNYRSTHVKIHKIVQCHICGKKMKHITLNNHVKVTHNQKLVQCSICNKTVLSGGFKKHLISHESPQLKCHICGSLKRTPVLLNNHIKACHEKTGNFKCGTCGKAFVCNYRLRKHCMTVHAKSTRPVLRFDRYCSSFYSQNLN